MALTKISTDINKPCMLRSALGAALLLHGMSQKGESSFKRLETLAGGLILVNGITGMNPLVKMFGAVTLPGIIGSVVNIAKETNAKRENKALLTQQEAADMPIEFQSSRRQSPSNNGNGKIEIAPLAIL